MPCCKERKLKLYLLFNESQKTDVDYKIDIAKKLEQFVGLTPIQSQSAVNFASVRDKCLIMDATSEVVQKTSLKLTLNNVPYLIK